MTAEAATITTVSAYDEALDALSSLITKRTRADKSNSGDRFDILFDYVKILDLEEAIENLKVIHVAGTKGKGSTCTFTESILRNCGFQTGLFTSPHLIDVRERFRLNGADIDKDKFLTYFWWCFNRLKENTNDDLPMPTYFRFLALLAFKIFAGEKVDVAILEVGLGGKFDATNVVQAPIVCGISSLGYDHMEILGYTLGEIAGEKAGILKQRVPAFTVPQPEEAMRVLQAKASQLDIQLQVVPPLDEHSLNGLHLGLGGEHQYVNAGLAIALCSAWLQRTGHNEIKNLKDNSSLPGQFVKGLTTANLQGRAQIVPDQLTDVENPGALVFYMDGAHTPESMEVCAKWFCSTIKEENKQHNVSNQQQGASSDLHDNLKNTTTRILLFNCMSVRDPKSLLPCLSKTCANHGIHFKKALFVPNVSVYNKVSTNASPSTLEQVDLSWQMTLQKVWENHACGEKGRDAKHTDLTCEETGDDKESRVWSSENSIVFPSLPLAISWLRDAAQQNKSVRFQVLVAGSLHLIGDVLRLIRK